MNKIKELLKQDFESSSGMTPQFKRFTIVFRNEFRRFLKSIGAENSEIHNGHFYVYGFFTYKNQVWYFNLGDVRWSKDSGMLIRTAEHYKDWTGGRNQFATIENMEEDIKKIIGA